MASGILAMLAKPKGKGASKEAPELGGSPAGGGEVGSALLEMFDALKAGDGEGAELAFRRAKEACDDSYEAEEPASEEMGDEETDELDL